MAVGYAINDTCFATQQEAITAYCSSFPQRNIDANGTYQVFCTLNTATNVTLKRYTDATAKTTVVVTPSFATCDTASKVDTNQATTFFSVAFVSVVLLFITAKTIGSIIEFVSKYTK